MENNRYKAHLTENHQLKAADALIAKLRQELGAANAYIQELEEDKKALEDELAKMKEHCKKINDKYSQDVNNFLRTDELYQKYVKVIDRVTKDVLATKRRNDQLIAEIVKLKYGGDNKEVVREQQA